MAKQADYGDNKAENVRLRQENNDMAAKERQYKKERRENEVLKGRVRKKFSLSKNFSEIYWTHYFRISKKTTLKSLIFFQTLLKDKLSLVRAEKHEAECTSWSLTEKCDDLQNQVSAMKRANEELAEKNSALSR